MAVPYWYIFWVSSEKICNNFVNYSKIFPVSYIHNLMFWIETWEGEQGTNTSKGKECPHPPAPHSSHLQSHGPGSSMCLIQIQLWWQRESDDRRPQAAQEEGTPVQSLNPAQNIQPRKLQVPDWTSAPKGARRAQWQPVASGTNSRARYISKRYLLWMVFKVEIHVNRLADQKNYLIQHALCQQTDVRSCESLTGRWHRLTRHTQESATCWISEGTSPQLFQDPWECPQPQHTTWSRSSKRTRLAVTVDIFHHFKAWTEIRWPLRSLLSLASPKIEETSEFGYFCCWLSNLTLTASVHKLYPAALTQSHGKFAGRRDE